VGFSGGAACRSYYGVASRGGLPVVAPWLCIVTIQERETSIHALFVALAIVAQLFVAPLIVVLPQIKSTSIFIGALGLSAMIFCLLWLMGCAP
jgi:hypothetical protein